jgi:hypothetical protein
MSAENSERIYQVYVIELDGSLCERHGCPATNGRPPVYVGQSVLSPEIRFDQHRRGYRSSRYVHKHGLRLLPELYADQSPYATRPEAEEAEAGLARSLRQQGFCVFGGH